MSGLGRCSRVACFVVASALFGCAHGTRPTVYLRAGEPLDLTKIDLHKQSLIMPLKAGETFPLDVSIEGEFVTSAPGASVELTVKRDCLVRVDDRGLRISADGRDFDAKSSKPGMFQVGLGVTNTGKRATLRVVPPTRELRP